MTDLENLAYYLWTENDDVCKLTPDWKTDWTVPDDNIWGFFVSQPEEGYCKFLDENGWEYAWYTYDEESADPISITGPWGGDWAFVDPEDFGA